MSAIDPRPVPGLRERLIQRNQDRVLEETPAPIIERVPPPKPVKLVEIPVTTPDDEGFTELAPIKGGKVLTPKLAISPKTWGAALNRSAHAEIGGVVCPIEVAIAPDGRFRIRIHPNPNAATAKVGVHGGVPRIGPYCRDFGFRPGDYPLEARDGALYGQLERQDDG